MLDWNILGTRPRKNLNHHFCGASGDRLRLVHHTADDAGPEVRVHTDVDRNGRGLDHPFHNLRREPDLAFFLGVPDKVDKRTRWSGFDCGNEIRQRPRSKVLELDPPLEFPQCGSSHLLQRGVRYLSHHKYALG